MHFLKACKKKPAERIRAQYGENKQITNGKYEKTLAVKCVNGTFVGKQPVGELRWKAPVDVTPDNGVYEAYYNAKSPRQNETISEGGSLYGQGL